MQDKDPFFALLGLFILGTTFFFCGERAVTSPPPVALEPPAEISPPASNGIELSPAPPVAAPAVLGKPINERLIGNTIQFRFNSATLLPEGKAILNGVAAILHEDPTVALEIDGQMDNVGPERANRVLLEYRAKAIVEYLTSKGIAAERLTSKWYGAWRPIAERAGNEGRWQNRRIEFSVETKEEQP